MTLMEMVTNYHKKNELVYKSEEYTHVYPDGSTEVFTIETAEKEKFLWDTSDRERYSACVLTKQFRVTAKSSMTGALPFDWFHGERLFTTIKSAINAIKKDVIGGSNPALGTKLNCRQGKK